MNYFYHPILFDVNEIVTLPVEESHHATRVLRMNVGDEIILINGFGQKALGNIYGQEGKLLKIQIDNIESQPQAKGRISVAVALLKKRDRLEWFIEKAVELGASKIIIFTSEHTEKKKAEAERLTKIAISALKQSGNLWLPEIITDQSFVNVVTSEFVGQKFVAHCEEGQKVLLKNAYKTGEDALVLIGPEGDFSPKEIDHALKNNFTPVSLGDLRLRAETAALTALITLKLMND